MKYLILLHRNGLLVTCGRSVVFFGYCYFLHDITEISLKVALNTINITYIKILTCELNIFSWILHCVKISSKYLYFLFSGHGPFSHLFDGKFIPTVRPELKWKVSYVFINIKFCVVCYSITNTLGSHCPSLPASVFHTLPLRVSTTRYEIKQYLFSLS